MEGDLFISKGKRYLREGCKCNVCDELLDHIAVIMLEWRKKKSRIKYHCIKCWNKVRSMGEITEEFSVRVGVPKGARPYFPKPPSTRSGYEVSVFDVAEIDKMGGETVDKTVYANREVEKVDKPQLDYDDDDILSIDDIDGYLLGIKPARSD